MIRSMTGYGAAALGGERLRGAVTARSLNHRYLDLAVHLGPRLQALEPEAKRLVQSRVRRGRVEVFVQLAAGEPGAEVQVAPSPVVKAVVDALRRLKSEHGLGGEVALGDVLRLPGIVQLAEPLVSVDEDLRQELLRALGHALQALDAMRRDEGALLEADLRRVLEAVEASTARLEAACLEGKAARRDALMARVRALREELGPEDPRLPYEVARLVERHDIDEELQRLRSHVAQARGLLGGQEACGKQLDFLAQELAREANTVGSKAVSAAVAQEVVALKGDIERLREQVQNVE